jgi:hypothetical protein
MPRPHLTPGKDPVLIVQEAGWASGPVWTGEKNLAPTGNRSPDRPARRQSLYRLRYPAHQFQSTTSKFCQISMNNFGEKIFFKPKSQEDHLHECSNANGVTAVNLPHGKISL